MTLLSVAVLLALMVMLDLGNLQAALAFDKADVSKR